MNTSSKFPLQSANRFTYNGISPHIGVRSETIITKGISHQEPRIRLTVLAAIVILCLSVFADKVSAQGPIYTINIGSSTRGGQIEAQQGMQNEPSIAVRPWDNNGNPDGLTIVVSYQSPYLGSEMYTPDPGNPLKPPTLFLGDWPKTSTFTSISKDGGQSWTPQTSLPLPTNTWTGGLSGTANQCFGAGDAKLSYIQTTGTGGQPQLLCVYSSYNDDDNIDVDGKNHMIDEPEGDGDDDELFDGGIFISCSSNDGKNWSSPSTVDDDVSTSFPGDVFATRPLIASDLNVHHNKAYVCWTEASHGTVPASYSRVMAATITAGTTPTVTNKHTVSPTDGSVMGGTYVEACAIAVASDGTVFLLWEKRNTFTSRDLNLSISTDEGATWSSTPISVVSGLTPPDASSDFDGLLGNPMDKYSAVRFGINIPDCEDYPTMTISKSGSTEAVYVAYSEGTSNASDMFLTSATYSSGTLGSFGTPTELNQIPAPTSGNTNNYSFQFQPALCPNGCGGVYLLYYSQQVSGTNPMEVPVLYGGEGPSCSCSLTPQAIGDPIPAFSKYASMEGDGVGDFMGIAWDPVNGVVHPVWTDVNTYISSSLAIYSTTLPPLQLGGSTFIGSLGFSNQRHLATTGNITHMVGIGLTNGSIQYSEQRTTVSSSSPPLTTKWTYPIIINDLSQGLAQNGNSYPSIGAYEKDAGVTGQKAVAVAWISPSESGSPNLQVRVSEFCGATNTSDLSVWSPVYSVSLPSSAATNSPLPNPVIAPITAPVSGTGAGVSSDRYLVGWVVTIPWAGKLQYVTFLRGSQTGAGLKVENESWGTDYGNFIHVPSSASYLSISAPASASLENSSFVTVTSNESNGNGLSPNFGGTDVTPSGTATQEVVFTDDGTKPWKDVWRVTATYNTSSGSLGELSANTDPKDLDGAESQYEQFFRHSFDRNPSVTITSTGQKIAAWEHIETPLFAAATLAVGTIGVATHGGGGAVPASICFSTASSASIRVRQSLLDGTWSSTFDVNSALANTTTFFDPRQKTPTQGWLVNPSITAFPKTTLTDVTTGLAGPDPGAAELLFWQQNAITPGGCTFIPSTPYKMHERQFMEINNLPHWGGKWNTGDPSGGNPVWPAGNVGISGANTQRSFGEYNNGPQYHSLPSTILWRDLGTGLTDQYINGMSEGLGNDVSGTIIGQTISSPSTTDISAAKIGTFDTALGVQQYRSETRALDSSSVTFKWGKVYVEDTALGSPIREVMLHNGTDSSFISNDAIRDSIFATEWFNWPVSAEIKYDRLMLFPVAGTLNHIIDTTINRLVFYDSVFVDTVSVNDTILPDTIPYYYMALDSIYSYDTSYDTLTSTNEIDSGWGYFPIGVDSSFLYLSSHIDTVLALDTIGIDSTVVFDTIYDTIPGTFTIDSSGRTDRDFIASGVSMKYTVQLVHKGGHIDTIEQLTYDPYDSLYIWPLTVHVANAGNIPDTVMLRVLGTMSGIPDADSNAEFERETMLDTYPSWGDTTIAVATGGGILPPPDSCFYAVGPYPNPSTGSGDNVSILVHYCIPGLTITAQVYNIIGSPVGSAVTFTSDGQVWDRMEIPAPSPGPYYIHVTVIGASATLSYTVF